MKISTAGRYKFLKDYRIGVPELLSNVSYNGDIIYGQNNLRKSIEWIYPEYIFEQIGEDINGNQNDKFGRVVSMNSMGDIIAVSAVYNYTGYTKIYQLSTYNNNSTWVQLGNTINGVEPYEELGFSLSINDTGNRVAIGSPGSNSETGCVRIYQLSSYNNINSWAQLGQKIDGLIEESMFGRRVSLNNIGDRVVIGSNANIVQTYQLSTYNNNNSWIKLGQDLTENGSQYGSDVSINKIGDIIAISDDSQNNGFGVVRVYQLQGNHPNESWIKLGEDILGKEIMSAFGYSISLNSSGNILAIGAPYAGAVILAEDRISPGYRGSVYVYKFENNTWNQIGQELNVKNTYGPTYTGTSVSLNSSGDILAIGSYSKDNYSLNGSSVGCTSIFQLSSYNNINSWIPLGSDIFGKFNVEYSGRTVSLNSIGNKIAIGSENNRKNGLDSGCVRVYNIDNFFKLDEPYTSFNDELITVNRPVWKYPKSLNIIGGWYNSYTKQFITDTSQLYISSGDNSNLFPVISSINSYKWVEFATKKNTNFSTSAIPLNSIYFKQYGFTPTISGGFPRNTLSFNYNNKTYYSEEFVDNLFTKAATISSTLSVINFQSAVGDRITNFLPEKPLNFSALGHVTGCGISSFAIPIATYNYTPTIALSSISGNMYTIKYKYHSYKNLLSSTDISTFIVIGTPQQFNFAYNARDSIKNRLTGVLPSTASKNIFIVKNPQSNFFIRNTQMFCYDLTQQLTSLVIYKHSKNNVNSGSLYSYGGVLITPRHVLYCAHAFPKTERLKFVRSDNTVVSADQLSGVANSELWQQAGSEINVQLQHPILWSEDWRSSYARDIGITVLDRDLSLSGIHVMPILALTPEDQTFTQTCAAIPKLLCSQAPGRTTNTPNPNLLSASDMQMTIATTSYFSDIAYVPLSARFKENTWDYYFDASKINPFHYYDIITTLKQRYDSYKLWDGDSGNSHMICVNDKLYIYQTTFDAAGRGALIAGLSGTINYLIEQADLKAGINTGLKATFYTIDQVLNR
jgi:hypothetical protein